MKPSNSMIFLGEILGIAREKFSFVRPKNFLIEKEFYMGHLAIEGLRKD